MALIGSLTDLKIADVLRMFAVGRKTGLLTITAGGGRQSLVRVHRGAPVHAVVGRLQGDDALLDLFGWKEGQLEFVPDDRSVVPNVTRTLEALLSVGAEEGERFHRINELIPSDRVAFRLAGGPAEGTAFPLSAAAFSILRLVDGVREVRELVERTGRPRPEVAGILLEMTEAHLLERSDVARFLRAQGQGRFGKSEGADLDQSLLEEWTKHPRFEHGVHRVEVRTATRKGIVLLATFRPGILRDVLLPRQVISDLGLAEGEDVNVRPIA